MSRRWMVVLLVVISASFVLSACGAGGQRSNTQLAPVSALPQAMQGAPERVRAAYQFAVANPDALANVPCYCGCGAIGHKSNLECYVKELKPDGTPVFDDHALGCSICVDIAQDVMRMTAEGRMPAAIREEIAKVYSQFGPSNQ